MLLSLWIGLAQAGELSWPAGESRTWYLESVVTSPVVRRVGTDTDRSSVRILTTKLRMVSTCELVDHEPRGAELRCSIEDISLVATRAVADEDADLQAALDEMDEALTGARLQIVQAPSGRIEHFDLEGVAADDERGRTQHEYMRQLLRRAWAGFDLPLEEGSTWSSSGGLVAAPPLDARWTGSARLEHEAEELGEGARMVRTSGVASIDLSDHQQRLALDILGSAMVDGDGLVLQHTWAAVGRPTASSSDAVISDGNPYHQGGFIQLLGEERPELGPTGPWSEHWEPGPADRALGELQLATEPRGTRTTRRPRHAFVAAGAVTTWRLDRGLAPGAELRGGLRLSSGFGVWGSYGAQLGGVNASGWAMRDQHLGLGVSLDQNRRVSPRVAASISLTRRGLPGADAQAAWLLQARPELGGVARLSRGDKAWLVFGAALPVDLRQTTLSDPSGEQAMAIWGVEPSLSLLVKVP